MSPTSEDPQNMFEVQNAVFRDLLEKEPSSKIAIIVRNAPLFRYFADRLDPDMWATWQNAAYGDGTAVAAIEGSYERFRSEVESSLARMDPDTLTAFTEAAEAGNVDMATSIVKTYFDMRDREGDAE